jgi:hypothetical protein
MGVCGAKIQFGEMVEMGHNRVFPFHGLVFSQAK